jgi:hypothetical protein
VPSEVGSLALQFTPDGSSNTVLLASRWKVVG